MFHVEQKAETLQLERDRFQELSHVPRGTLEKLDRYVALLTEWNSRVNLVSQASLDQVWIRHIWDCYQLVPFLANAQSKKITDLGSGAGLPGIILSIAGLKNIHLIESIGKKARFLECIIKELALSAYLHHVRIEDLDSMASDIVTARALAPLPLLLPLARKIGHKRTQYIFYKGKNLEQELTESQKCWKYDYEIVKSQTSDEGALLIINNLMHK